MKHKITFQFEGKSVSKFVSDKFYQANKNKSYITELLFNEWKNKYGQPY